MWYFPLDAPLAIRRALRAIRPHIFLTVETELWPNFLHLARCQGACTFLVNGRVSDNLLRVAPRLGLLWRWMMGNLDGFLMRSEFDAERIAQLGAPAARVFAVGDVKLDAAPDDDEHGTAETRSQWRRTLGVATDAPLWVVGSTHPGEEEIVLQTYARLRAKCPRCGWCWRRVTSSAPATLWRFVAPPICRSYAARSGQTTQQSLLSPML